VLSWIGGDKKCIEIKICEKGPFSGGHKKSFFQVLRKESSKQDVNGDECLSAVIRTRDIFTEEKKIHHKNERGKKGLCSFERRHNGQRYCLWVERWWVHIPPFETGVQLDLLA
jgi:hypothetical protein